MLKTKPSEFLKFKDGSTKRREELKFPHILNLQMTTQVLRQLGIEPSFTNTLISLTDINLVFSIGVIYICSILMES